MSQEQRKFSGVKADELGLGDKPPVFVLSTGRSGSTMLARALGLHSSLYAVHEPQPKLNAESFAEWTDSHSRDQIESKTALKRDWLIAQTHYQDLVYVESAYFLAHLVPVLHRLYGAKFIHLHRNGMDFVRSGYERPWYVDRRHPATVMKRWIRRRWLIDIGVSNEDHQLPTPEGLTSRFEKISWLWMEINRVIMEDLAELADEYSLQVAVEDLNQERDFRRITDFIGVEPTSRTIEEMVALANRKPNKDSDHTLPKPADWRDERRERFEQIAGGMMKRLGYM